MCIWTSNKDELSDEALWDLANTSTQKISEEAKVSTDDTFHQLKNLSKTLIGVP